MASFDVISLFTKVPIQLALNIAKQRLQSDSELSQRTGLSTTDLVKGTWNLLKFSQLYVSWKTLQSCFWNSNGLPRLMSSGKLCHGKHWNASSRNLCRPSTFVEKICRWHFCDHEKIKVFRILDTSEHNRKLRPNHNGKRKRRMPSVFGSID